MANNGISLSIDGYGLPLLLLFVAAAWGLLWKISEPHMDPREPALFRPSIPFVGHLIGLMREQMNYYAIICRKSPFPNFTMPVMNSKVYVITSPLLAQAALRHKDLDFTTFIAGIGLRPLALEERTMEKIRKDSADRKADSYLNNLHKAIYEKLGPGPSLDNMNARMLTRVAVTLNNIGDVLEVNELWPWLQETFTLATTFSFYGENDPFNKDHRLVRALWDYDEQVTLLLLGIYPSIIARRGYQGLKTIKKALGDYFKAGYNHSSDVSGLTRERGILHRKFGFDITEQGDVEFTMAWAGTTNAIPALYWMLRYIASDVSLLNEIRSEVSNVITTTSEGVGRTLTFNITRFTSDCPLLFSTYQEINRLTNSGVSIRIVEVDTVLSAGAETVLLKKGNVVQIPVGIMHTSAAIWGSNSDTFDGRRFLKSATTAITIPATVEEDVNKREKEKQKRSAYIPFGGGKHLCPGRHFAQAEILGMIAALITGFDIFSLDGTHSPEVPDLESQAKKKFGQASMKPIGEGEKLGMRLVRRASMEGVKLGFSV